LAIGPVFLFFGAERECSMILEACVGTVEQAVRAERNGAGQLELCDRLDLDGTTPPTDLVQAVLDAVSLPVKVILNPVAFDYCYNGSQMDGIVRSMRELESLGVSGFVFGALTEQKLPDIEAVKRIAESTSLPLTFHKAIDQTSDLEWALGMLIEADCVRFVLSSGGEKTAAAGQVQLGRMRDRLAQGNSSIELIAAGSITAGNLPTLHQKLGLTYYHGKRVVDVAD
jgi:copper homeostasis protein